MAAKKSQKKVEFFFFKNDHFLAFLGILIPLIPCRGMMGKPLKTPN